VLLAAETLFAERGLDTTIGAIAARAGVGIGTVYRSVGSKEQLIEALYRTKVSDAAALITSLGAQATGWEALTAIVRTFTDLAAENRALFELLIQHSASAGALLRREIAPLLEAVVARAQHEGTLRADFAATDVPLLAQAAGAIAAAGTPAAARASRRIIEFVLKGVTATPDPIPIDSALSDDEIVDWIGSSFRTLSVSRELTP